MELLSVNFKLLVEMLKAARELVSTLRWLIIDHCLSRAWPLMKFLLLHVLFLLKVEIAPLCIANATHANELYHTCIKNPRKQMSGQFCLMSDEDKGLDKPMSHRQKQ